MSTHISSYVKCPFYVRDDTRTCKLTCEGMLPGTSIGSHFLNKADLVKYMEEHCIEAHKSCPWARCLYGYKYRENVEARGFGDTL